MQREDVHPSHDIKVSWHASGPHSVVLACAFCDRTTCAICEPGAGADDPALGTACDQAPAGWRDPTRRLALEVILEDIARPRESPWAFSGSMSFRFAASPFHIVSGAVSANLY